MPYEFGNSNCPNVYNILHNYQLTVTLAFASLIYGSSEYSLAVFYFEISSSTSSSEFSAERLFVTELKWIITF